MIRQGLPGVPPVYEHVYLLQFLSVLYMKVFITERGVKIDSDIGSYIRHCIDFADLRP